MKSKKRALLAILVPLGLGSITASIFLANYLGRNRVAVTLVNLSGIDVMGGTLRVPSQTGGQEIGPIPGGDSAILVFTGVSDGEFRVEMAMKDGTRLSDSLGYVTHGMDFAGRMVIDSADGALRIGLSGGR